VSYSSGIHSMHANLFRRCTIKHTETVGPQKESMSKWIQCNHWPEQSMYNHRKWRGMHSFCPARVTKQGKRVREKTGHKAQINWIY